MKISKTTTNLLVSYVDRYFTWDWRTMKREDPNEWFDFFGVRQDDDRRLVVTVDRLDRNHLYVSIRENDTLIYSHMVKSYKDISTFKRMVRCLG